MKLPQIKPAINHINFVHSYVIKAKDGINEQTLIEVKEIIDEVVVRISELSYMLKDFPEGHVPYTYIDYENNCINVLALPKTLLKWDKK